MGGIIDLSRYAHCPDPDGMGREELLDYLDAVLAQIGRLDEQEPEDMDSEAYEDWGDRHEALEDLADEIRDLLDGPAQPGG